MKILINTPDLSLSGGVANHYKGLCNYWNTRVVYNYVGGRKGLPGMLFLPYDYIKFSCLCLFGSYDAIVLNPSLNKTAIARDAVFLKIASLFKMNCWVFWHGWDVEEEKKINANSHKFLNQFKHAHGFFVLASVFKDKLKQWGIDAPIHLTSTKVDDSLLVDFDITKKQYLPLNLLFLARLEKEKGIFTTIEAFEIVSRKIPNCNLFIAGKGNSSQQARELVEEKFIHNVYFLGNLSGESLIQIFRDSSIYILPTTHGEGMPTSVLEAMAFGLPVITRPVGGLNDFFEDGKMGYLIESLDPQDYAEKIVHLMENTELCRTMGAYNHNYAKSHFLASQVACQLESIVKDA